MSKDYKFTFKKDDIFVEFDTTDKEALARQFQIWVTCASVYTYQHKRQEEIEKEAHVDIQKNFEQQVADFKPEPIVMPIEEVKQEIVEADENRVTLNNLQNQPVADVSEFEMKSEPLTLEEKKKEIAQTVEKAGVIGENLDNLYQTEEAVLNSLETFKEKIEDNNDFANKETDFDKILEMSMSNAPEHSASVEVKKDDRFLKILKVKDVSSKLEYLIVTAYYLSEFEKLDKFTLKLINAKLMQNIKEAVDHNVLQDAIEKGLVEVLPSLPDIASSVEYRLTNAGEEAFLNGTRL